MSTNRKPGWVVVLDAFMAAPNRTLTNADLGALHGIQAWHQRISDLKRYGYLVTPSVKIRQGYYAYRLVGLAGSVDDKRPYADVLPRLTGDAQRDAIMQASIELREADIPDRTTSSAAPAIKAVPGSAEKLHEVIDQTFRLLSPDEPQGTTREVAEDVRLMVQAEVESRGTVEAKWKGARDVIGELTDRIGSLAGAFGLSAAEDEGSLELLDRLILLVGENPTPPVARKRRTTKAGKAREPRKGTGPALIAKVLGEAGEPLHASVIVKRVLALDGARPKDSRAYKGKTPAATIGAQLATAAKRDDGLVIRTAPNTFRLREV